MILAPLLAAKPAIQFHAVAALGAFVIGVVQFAAPKGTVPHRALGWIWVVLMLTVAATAFLITGHAGEGRFSWIHLLAVGSLVAVPMAVLAARRHRVRAHQRAMTMIFLGALAVAGVFTLLPGRVMNQVAFGQASGQAGGN